jgi:DNA-directed RNA polymerase I subunit RPA43
MDDVKPEKKHKRSKEQKKRPREEDENATPRHHKKSKKHGDEQAPDADDNAEVRQDEIADGHSKKKSKKNKKSKDDELDQGHDDSSKKSKKKHRKRAETDPEVENVEVAATPDAEETPKKQKKEKSKKEKRAEEDDEQPAEDTQSKRKSKKKRKDRERAAVPDEDAMDVDAAEPAATTSSSSSDPSFPFFTQTISLYVPFFPIGFDKPITNVASQHLDPLLNHYSPLLRGVLLAYRNVNLSERPVRPNPKNLPDDHTPALVESLDEYAVGFGWLTADVDLFIPSRGAWMEGTVNLQSEGHIGVVCWNKFNASIEAKRLPAGWRWVDLSSSNSDTNGTFKGKHTYLTADPDAPSAGEAENEGEEEEGTDILDDSPLELAELHTTGYWVDAAGERVSAAPLRFRIKNFDVGVAGDYGYISIEGTTLADDEEREMGRQEREVERRRRDKQNPSGLLRPMLRRVPEFSLTSFGKEEQEDDSNTKTVLYRGSRPGTPDD